MQTFTSIPNIPALPAITVNRRCWTFGHAARASGWWALEILRILPGVLNYWTSCSLLRTACTHFSLFGAFSGFDAIEECFEDLTPYIHALETGLSSDPPMNWRISALDGYALISNSDAHSPAKLGREANLLDIEPSYAGLSDALQGLSLIHI